jgi:histidine triad (HIT) family protein
MASIFTKIINGELPCYKIYEDQLTFAFLALDQVNLGHTLVIPKKEVNHFFETPEPDYSAVWKTAKMVSQAIKTATNSPRVGIMVAGFEVQHFHVHLIPAWSIPDLSFSRAKKHSPEEMNQIMNAIVKNLKN